MNKFYMNGKLIHKASDHNTKRCEVEKWVFLPHSDFVRLKANPYCVEPSNGLEDTDYGEVSIRYDSATHLKLGRNFLYRLKAAFECIGYCFCENMIMLIDVFMKIQYNVYIRACLVSESSRIFQQNFVSMTDVRLCNTLCIARRAD